MGDGTLRSIADQLDRSTGGVVRITLDPLPSPNGSASDGVVQFNDHDNVVFDSSSNATNKEEVRVWIRGKITAYVSGHLKDWNGLGLLYDLIDRCIEPDHTLDEDNFKIELVDENETYVSLRKFWFWIGPTTKKSKP